MTTRDLFESSGLGVKGQAVVGVLLDVPKLPRLFQHRRCSLHSLQEGTVRGTISKAMISLFEPQLPYQTARIHRFPICL